MQLFHHPAVHQLIISSKENTTARKKKTKGMMDQRTLGAEEFARNVEGLASHNDNALPTEELLSNDASQATKKVTLAVDNDLKEKGKKAVSQSKEQTSERENTYNWLKGGHSALARTRKMKKKKKKKEGKKEKREEKSTALVECSLLCWTRSWLSLFLRSKDFEVEVRRFAHTVIKKKKKKNSSERSCAPRGLYPNPVDPAESCCYGKAVNILV